MAHSPGSPDPRRAADSPAGAPGEYAPGIGIEGNQLTDPNDASGKLFDLRKLIGALFTLYGVLLIIASFFVHAQNRAKSGGIDIDLWMGIGMLVVGVLFLWWARAKPLVLGPASALAMGEGDRQGSPVVPH